MHLVICVVNKHIEISNELQAANKLLNDTMGDPNIVNIFRALTHIRKANALIQTLEREMSGAEKPKIG